MGLDSRTGARARNISHERRRLRAQVGMGNQLLSALHARSFHTLAHGRPQLRQLTSKVLLVTTEDRGDSHAHRC